MTDQYEIVEPTSVPSYITDLHIVYDDVEYQTYNWRLKHNIYAELSRIPRKYLDSFISRGWRFEVIDRIGDKWPEYSTANGLTTCYSCDDSCRGFIAVETRSAGYDVGVMAHEFGHFATCSSSLTPYLKALYNKEAEAFADYDNNRYSLTNELEFFASAFSCVLSERDDPDLYADMEAAFPLTLSVIEDGFLDCDRLYDIRTIREIVNG